MLDAVKATAKKSANASKSGEAKAWAQAAKDLAIGACMLVRTANDLPPTPEEEPS